MLKITRLRITIEPRYYARNFMRELRVETTVDGVFHATVIPFDDDDFDSHFDHLMNVSRLEIIKLVKAHEQNNQR